MLMRMIAKRILTLPLTMLIVSLLVFSCISFSSGDSSSFILSEDATDAEISAYRERAGLDRPFSEQYADFLKSFFIGDWGYSSGGAEIRSLVLSRLPVTLSVSFFSLFLSVLIALPISYLTMKRKTIRSSAGTGYAVLVSSSPVFLLSIFLILIFSVMLRIFPVAGYVPLSRGIFLHLGSIFLPSLSLALLHSSLLVLMFRNALRENMEKPFSISAHLQGMKRWKIAVRNATKPSLPILVMLLGESAAAFLGGSAAVETVFALPGIGSLLVSSALSRDSLLAGTIMLIVALLVSLSSLAAEIISILLDPRNRRR